MSDVTVDERASGTGGFLLAAVAGTLLSMARTGLVSGISNNMLHFPILAGLAKLPQFAADPFIQSLRYYSSGLWLALAGAAPGDAAFPLLLGLAVASRFLALVGFLACANVIGIRDRKGRLLFAVLIAFSSVMNGYSAAGQGGLFINYFTHSELANAVWSAVPLGLIAILLLARREIGWPTLLARMALGLVAFLVLASPAIYSIVTNPAFGRPVNFDYPTFLT